MCSLSVQISPASSPVRPGSSLVRRPQSFPIYHPVRNIALLRYLFSLYLIVQYADCFHSDQVLSLAHICKYRDAPFLQAVKADHFLFLLQPHLLQDFIHGAGDFPVHCKKGRNVRVLPDILFHPAVALLQRLLPVFHLGQQGIDVRHPQILVGQNAMLQIAVPVALEALRDSGTPGELLGKKADFLVSLPDQIVRQLLGRLIVIRSHKGNRKPPQSSVYQHYRKALDRQLHDLRIVILPLHTHQNNAFHTQLDHSADRTVFLLHISVGAFQKHIISPFPAFELNPQ